MNSNANCNITKKPEKSKKYHIHENKASIYLKWRSEG
jgi:hypothetical protein